MRIFIEYIFLNPMTFSPSLTASPHMPARAPPPTGINPLRTVSSYAYIEYEVSSATVCLSSSSVALIDCSILHILPFGSTNRFRPPLVNETGESSLIRISVSDERSARGSRETGNEIRLGSSRSNSFMSIENTPLFKQKRAENKVNGKKGAD